MDIFVLLRKSSTWNDTMLHRIKKIDKNMKNF